MILMLGLFLRVYDAASFFSDEEVATFLATLSLVSFPDTIKLVCTYDPEEHTLQLGTPSFPHNPV